jgi:hypothetical protein
MLIASNPDVRKQWEQQAMNPITGVKDPMDFLVSLEPQYQQAIDAQAMADTQTYYKGSPLEGLLWQAQQPEETSPLPPAPEQVGPQAPAVPPAQEEVSPEITGPAAVLASLDPRWASPEKSVSLLGRQWTPAEAATIYWHLRKKKDPNTPFDASLLQDAAIFIENAKQAPQTLEEILASMGKQEKRPVPAPREAGALSRSRM